MRAQTIMLSLIIITGSFSGCLNSDKLYNGKYCYENQSDIDNTLDIENIENWKSRCAKLQMSIEVNNETILNQSIFVGLDSQDSDIIIINLNETSLVSVDIEVLTLANFSLLTINSANFNNFVNDDIYDEILNLSSSCVDNCSFNSELDSGFHYLVLNLE